MQEGRATPFNNAIGRRTHALAGTSGWNSALLGEGDDSRGGVEAVLYLPTAPSFWKTAPSR